MIDSDGFTYYDCSECGKLKMAALFTPEQIAGSRRCRVCTGEMGRGHSKAHKPAEAQQPRAVYAAPGAISLRG